MPATDTGRLSGSNWKFEAPTSGGDATAPTLGTTELVMQPASPTVSWATSTSSGQTNHSQPATVATLESTHVGTVSLETSVGGLRTYSSTGDSGATEILEDGAERCVAVGIRASGWIQIELPWTAVNNWKESDIRNAWQDGTHFFGLQLSIRGVVGDETHVTLGSAWALHLPRPVSYTHLTLPPSDLV